MSPDDTPQSSDAGAGEAPYSETARRWSELLDGWWREQAAGLPPELERVMAATLAQSKALVQVVCEQAAGALEAAPTGTSQRPPPGARAPSGPGPDLWQPVIDACRACEADVLGAPNARTASAAEAGGEYQRALRAYLEEFAELNREVAERVRRKIAASDPPVGFRALHALVVNEAEQAYLERVSADRFAARQASFINALFRLRRESRRDGGAAGEP